MEGVFVDVLNRLWLRLKAFGIRLVDGERALRAWLWASLVCNMGIIVTGAVVRLTGSGLGCSTWPKCTDDSYVPHEASGIHGIIEFGNRTLTFVLILAALGAFFAAWRNRGLRSPLWWLTLGIGIGIPFQGVIGGITVLTHLNPYVVALHLLLSVALIVLCVWALRMGYGTRPETVTPLQHWLVIATFVATMAATWIGTLVTGAGPHAGDEKAVRNGLEIDLVARAHGVSAWVTVALVVATLLAVRSNARLTRIAGVLFATVLMQGLIGYVQYFLGVPAGVVGLHMVGLALLTAAVSWLLVSTTRRTYAEQPGADAPASIHAA